MIEVNLILNFNSQSLERKLALDYVDLLVGGIKVRETENRWEFRDEYERHGMALSQKRLMEGMPMV